LTRIALFGGAGRMGRALREAAGPDFPIVALIDPGAAESPTAGGSGGDIDVVIDFSTPGAFDDLDALLQDSGAALVSGTTALASRERAMLERWSRERPVFHSPNMSFGIYMLSRLVFEAARISGERYDFELVEYHHRTKQDSPSGTALRLLEAWKAGTGRDFRITSGRSGASGRRSPEEAGIFSVRGGDVAGDHEVHLLGDGERLTLVHRSSGLRTFALGALLAAASIVGRPPGLYGMDDLVEWRGGCV
jgi:4-hydroxy-tetrahydrodipicolinate reductase